MQYVWILVSFYEYDGDAYLDKPKVFTHRKDAEKVFNDLVRVIYERQLNDEIVNELNGKLFFHLATDKAYWSVYVKRVKVR